MIKNSKRPKIREQEKTLQQLRKDTKKLRLLRFREKLENCTDGFTNRLTKITKKIPKYKKTLQSSHKRHLQNINFYEKRSSLRYSLLTFAHVEEKENLKAA